MRHHRSNNNIPPHLAIAVASTAWAAGVGIAWVITRAIGG